MEVLLRELTLAVGLMVQQQVDLPEDELICLTRNIYHEARGEDLIGQFAVAHTTMNRVESGEFADTICEVIAEPGQFSWTEDGLSDLPADDEAYQKAMLVAIAAMIGVAPDPAPGATYYYAPAEAKPYWAEKFIEVAEIGNHRFMKE